MLCPNCRSISFTRIGKEKFQCQDCKYVWTLSGHWIAKKFDVNYINSRKKIRCMKCGYSYIPANIDERKRCIKCETIHSRSNHKMEIEEKNNILESMEDLFIARSVDLMNS